MALKKPYYALHQIETGKYTSGGEYYKQNGVIYVGPYHILPNGQVYTGFTPFVGSEELFVLSNQLVQESQYRRITKVKTGNYSSPTFYYAFPTDNDKRNGFFIRYFVQQKNQPRSTIVEVDEDQYNSTNIINGPGINGNIWRRLKINWVIKGDIDVVIQLNQNTLELVEPRFPGIKSHLSNLIEFVV